MTRINAVFDSRSRQDPVSSTLFSISDNTINTHTVIAHLTCATNTCLFLTMYWGRAWSRCCWSHNHISTFKPGPRPWCISRVMLVKCIKTKFLQMFSSELTAWNFLSAVKMTIKRRCNTVPSETTEISNNPRTELFPYTLLSWITVSLSYRRWLINVCLYQDMV